MSDEAGKRFLVVRKKDGTTVQLDITNCYWCGNREHLCSLCSSKADAIRKS